MTTTLLAAPGSPPEEPTEDLTNRLSHLGMVLRRQSAHVDARRPAMGVEGVRRDRRVRRMVLVLAPLLIVTGATLVATRAEPNPIVGLIADPLPERFDTIDEQPIVDSEGAEGTDSLVSVDGVDAIVRISPPSPVKVTGNGFLEIDGIRVETLEPSPAVDASLPTQAFWRQRGARFRVTLRVGRPRTVDVMRLLVRSSTTGRLRPTSDVRVIATWTALPTPYQLFVGERSGVGVSSRPFAAPQELRTRIQRASYGLGATTYRVGFEGEGSSTPGAALRPIRLSEATRLAKRWDAQLAASLRSDQWMSVGPGVAFARVDDQTTCVRVNRTVACDRQPFSRLINGHWYVVNTEQLVRGLLTRAMPGHEGYELTDVVQWVPDDVTSFAFQYRTIHRPRW